MTLLDATPPPKPRKTGRYILVAVVILIVAGTSYFLLRNLPEERAVSRFLDTLEQGSFQEAYRLWQPGALYSYQDFLQDWGDHGQYGKIRAYRILSAHSWASQTVIVTVTINNQQPPLQLLVDRRTKGLAYAVSVPTAGSQ
jgi:hypothetical protein